MRRPLVIVICSIVAAFVLLGWWLVSCYPTYKTVPELIADLRDEDSNVRVRAATSLGTMGSEAAEAVPVLIGSLRDDHVWVRIEAVRALGRIGNEPGVADALAGALNDEHHKVKEVAIYALKEIGPEPEVVAVLIGGLGEGDEYIQRLIIDTFRDFGPLAIDAIPALLELYEKGGEDFKPVIINSLVAISQEREIFDIVFDALDDESFAVRMMAVKAIGDFGEMAEPAIPMLIEIIEDKDVDSQLRGTAILNLRNLSDYPGVAETLVGAIWDESRQVYSAALQALGDSGDIPGVVTALIEVINSDDPERPMHAAYALAKIGQDASDAVPHLIELYDDEDLNVRKAAIYALGEIYPHAEIVATLVEALEDPSPQVQMSASDAIGKVGGDAIGAVPALLGLLERGDWQRLNAARTLNRVDESYIATTIPLLLELMDNDDPILQSLSAVELARLGPKASDALPKLREILRRAPLRHKRGKLTDQPVGMRSKSVEMQEKRVYIAVAYAISVIDRGNVDAMYVLIQGLGDDYQQIRIHAIEVLAELGADAAPALPMLQDIAADRLLAAEIRKAAEKAIDKIED